MLRLHCKIHLMKMTSKIKAVFFDFDGVIVQTETYKIHNEYIYFKKLGLNVTLKQMYGIAGGFHNRKEEVYDQIFGDLNGYQEVKDQLIEHRVLSFPIEELITSGIKEVISWCKKEGLLIAVCSNSKMERLMRDLSIVGIVDDIDYIGAAFDSGHMKPDPYIYLTAMEEFNIDCDECIIVEDSVLGIHAGILSNGYVVALADKDRCIDQREANEIIYDIKELKRIIMERSEQNVNL